MSAAEAAAASDSSDSSHHTLVAQELADSGGRAFSTAVFFAVLMTLFFALRLYTRWLKRKPFACEDALLTAAYVFNACLCAVIIAMSMDASAALHVEDIEREHPAQLVRWLRLILAAQSMHYTAVTLPRLAMLFISARLFGWSGRMLVVCYATMALLVASWAAFVIASFLQCTPLAFWWDKTISGGSCFDVRAFYRAQAVTSPVFDLVIIVLAVTSISTLRLPLGQKVELLLAFSIVGSSVVASVVRAHIFFSRVSVEDLTWATLGLGTWSVVEAGNNLVTACLPELKTLLHHCFPTRPRDRPTHEPESHCGTSTERTCEDGFAKQVFSQEEDAIECIDGDGRGNRGILVTQRTEVRVDKLESMERPWELIGSRSKSRMERL